MKLHGNDKAVVAFITNIFGGLLCGRYSDAQSILHGVVTGFGALLMIAGLVLAQQYGEEIGYLKGLAAKEPMRDSEGRFKKHPE